MEPHNVVALSSRGDTKRMLHDAGAQNMFFFCRGFLWCFCLFIDERGVSLVFCISLFFLKACEGFFSERSMLNVCF